MMTERSQGFDFAGQRLVVTGAGGGIGRAVVRLAGRLGAEVVASDLRDSAALAADTSP